MLVLLLLGQITNGNNLGKERSLLLTISKGLLWWWGHDRGAYVIVHRVEQEGQGQGTNSKDLSSWQTSKQGFKIWIHQWIKAFMRSEPSLCNHLWKGSHRHTQAHGWLISCNFPVQSSWQLVLTIQYVLTWIINIYTQLYIWYKLLGIFNIIQVSTYLESLWK